MHTTAKTSFPTARARRYMPPVRLLVSRWSFTPFDDLANLQRRLAYEAATHEEGDVSLLIASHEALISRGSITPPDPRMECDELSDPPTQEMESLSVLRGGAAWLHGPGCLSLHVIAPVARLRWSPGHLLRCLQEAVLSTFALLNVPGIELERTGTCLRGRSGILAEFGIAIRHGISTFGGNFYLQPAPELVRRFARQAPTAGKIGSLLLERLTPDRIEGVTPLLVAQLSQAFAAASVEVSTGHPLLPDCSHVAESAA